MSNDQNGKTRPGTLVLIIL